MGAARMGVIDFILALMQGYDPVGDPGALALPWYSMSPSALPWCALLGALGHGSRMVMMTAGFNIEWSTFMASLLVGCIGIQWSRWYLAHPKVFTVAAVIPMFPGISAYTAMISAVKSAILVYSEVLMITLLTNFLKASSIVGALPSVCPCRDYGCIANVHAFNGVTFFNTAEGNLHHLLSFFSDVTIKAVPFSVVVQY